MKYCMAMLSFLCIAVSLTHVCGDGLFRSRDGHGKVENKKNLKPHQEYQNIMTSAAQHLQKRIPTTISVDEVGKVGTVHEVNALVNVDAERADEEGAQSQKSSDGESRRRKSQSKSSDDESKRRKSKSRKSKSKSSDGDDDDGSSKSKSSDGKSKSKSSDGDDDDGSRCGGGKKELAFPGAMGPGTYTPGGRYGKLRVITDLKDDGKSHNKGGSISSLRGAVTEVGDPTFIVFQVGGIIKLVYKCNMRHECACKTVAGHSAPPPGITVADHTFGGSCRDFIIRYMRFRQGDRGCNRQVMKEKGKCECTGDAVSLGESSRLTSTRMVVDHLSAAWGSDETLSVDGVAALTMSYCFVTQALHASCHGKYPKVSRHGMGTRSTKWKAGTHVAMHHNLWAHTASRTPKLDNQVRTYEKGQTSSKYAVKEGAKKGGEYDKQRFFYYNNVNFGGRPYGGKSRETSLGLRGNFVNNVFEEPAKIFGSGGTRDGTILKKAGSLKGQKWAGNKQGVFFYSDSQSILYHVGNKQKFKGSFRKNENFDGTSKAGGGGGGKGRGRGRGRRGKGRKGGRGRKGRSGRKRRRRKSRKRRRRKKSFLQVQQEDTAPPKKAGDFYEDCEECESLGAKISDAQSAEEAYKDVLDHAGVWPLRDRVDQESLDLIKKNILAFIDSPGGCCVSGEKCSGFADIKKVSASACKMTSCYKSGFADSDKCSKYAKDWDAPFADLNSELNEESGVDWKKERGKDDGDFTDLENFLEGCLFPYKKGSEVKCTAKGG